MVELGIGIPAIQQAIEIYEGSARQSAFVELPMTIR